MYVSEEATKIAKIKCIIFFYIPAVIFFVIILDTSNKENFVSMIITLPAMFTVGFYFLFGGFIERRIQKKMDIENENKRKEEEAQAYELKTTRELERKRQELDIEFEHYRKMAMLHAQTDENKMRMIAQMEKDLTNTKNRDLESLRMQLDNMKKEYNKW